ncbi:uncharacterized protein TA13890 [Theileria annulata]|uniref:Uncharacterized protein n=1 Tax=Theileria annulata TaxID=5874 RepID=Q4UES2_THEAN|nr:uncharacterized protein TA13890 [Theileria annulata]CAI74417.1 hypothetical protein TA13890 [Theileria annulata]|eukprot:XP_952149.1 hypothetical protein TA13890 [Theileria annulata]
MVIGNMDSTHPKNETTKIDKGNVTIKTGTVENGECKTATPPKITGGSGKHASKEGKGATLTLSVTDATSLAAIEDTSATQCNVSVDTDKLTIKYTDTAVTAAETAASTNKLQSANLTLNASSGGGNPDALTYKFPRPITLNSTITVKLKLQDTNITITQSGTSNTVKATLTTIASKSTTLTTLKTGVDLNLTTGPLQTPKLKLNNEAIKTSTELKTGEKITLTGNIGTGTTIEATGPIEITDKNGQPSDTSLTLSDGATVNLSGGLTGSGNLTIDNSKATLSGVNLAAVQYDPKELHDVHKTYNCCYYGKFNLWKRYQYAPDWTKPTETTPVHAYLSNFFDLLMVIKISLGLHFTNACGTEGNPANDADNAVTLSAGSFQSKATIKVTDYNFQSLKLVSGQSLTISINSGTIKNATNNLQIGSPELTKDTVLVLNANGSLSGGSVSGNVPVTLKGIIVVTSTDKPIGKNTLTITGSGTSNGVSGTLNLGNQTSPPKHMTITGGTTSKITIDKTAYDNLTDKTTNTLKIGASHSTPRDPTNATGYNHTQDTSIGIHANILKTAAGASESEPSDGLRALAKALHDKANNLNDAVKNVADNENAAKVLKHKAGTNDQASDSKYLRGLAEKLYESAQALADKVTGSPDDDGKANDLAEAVGESESATGIRKELKALAGAKGTDLNAPAQAVKTAYENGLNGVKPKFEAVKGQKEKYTDPAKYQAVVDAWNAFNAVYNPEEQLMDAVNSLQGALNQLADASIINLHSKAEEVKKKFEGWGTGVKSKFELVQKQENAYTAERSYILINSTGLLFILSLYLVRMVTKTEYVFHKVGDDKNGFGGWRTYKKHKPGGSGGCADDEPVVHNWFWHFFDILDASQNRLTITYKGDDKAKVENAGYTEEQVAGTTNYKYTVTDAKNITYTIVTTSQLTDSSATATGTVTIEYGHIFAEGFISLEDPEASEHKPGGSGGCADAAEADNLVHAWIWHFFDILIVLKILLTAILYIHSTPAILWTLAYGIYTDTKIKEAITKYPPDPSIKTINYGTPPNCNANQATANGTASIEAPTDLGATLTITTIYS